MLATGSKASLDQLLTWLIHAFRSVDPQAVAFVTSVDPEDLLRRVEPLPVGLPELPSGQPDLESLCEELHTEYVRLFVNDRASEPAHPEALAYAAAHSRGGPAAFLHSVQERAREVGVELDAASVYPLDHLTVLLELLYLEGHGDVESLRQSVVTRELLRPWLGEFLERLEGLEPHVFYRNAARVLGVLTGVEEPA